MSSDPLVRDLREEEYEAWNVLVNEAPEGSPYSTPEYLDALCRSAGGRFRISAAFRGEEITGGVGLYERSGPLGRRVGPRLLLYYHGPVLRHYPTRYPSTRDRRHLRTLDVLEASLRASGYAGMILSPRSPVQDLRIFVERGWRVEPRYSYVVEIGDPGATWERIEQNLRRLVGRAEAEGITVTCDDDFDSFFRLHLETHQRKGAPLYLPEAAFRRYVEDLLRLQMARIYHARLAGGRSVATQLVVAGGHPVAHTVCAGSDADHLSTGAAVLLRWKGFEHLHADGFRANDLTDASLNPVSRFKAQLGGSLELSLQASRETRASRLVRPAARFVGRVRGVTRRLGRLGHRRAPAAPSGSAARTDPGSPGRILDAGD